MTDAPNTIRIERLRSRLRAAIQGLRLRPLNLLEDQFDNEMADRIRLLPSAEAILRMNHEQLVDLRRIVGRLMYDINLREDQRSIDQHIQSTNRTGLPPRRRPLLATNWYQEYKKGA